MVDSVIQIGEPFNLFHDIDGNPLEDGYIYIGQSGLDPISNPITVYSDYALTLPIAQPIRTEGGYPMIGGTPAKIYIPLSLYSITVLNKRGTLIYTDLVVEYDSNSAQITFSDIQAAADLDLTGLNVIQTQSFWPWVLPQTPKGGGSYHADNTTGTPSTIYSNNLGFFDANGNGYSLSVVGPESTLNVFQVGALGDGITDDTLALQSAHDSGYNIEYPPGDFIITTALQCYPGTTITGACMGSIISNTFAGVNVTKITNSQAGGGIFWSTNIAAGGVAEGVIVQGFYLQAQFPIRFGDRTQTIADDVTQPARIKPKVLNCYIQSRTQLSGIGIEFAKCFDGEIAFCEVVGFSFTIILAGSDLNVIHDNRLLDAANSHILNYSTGTYGSQNEIRHNDILYVFNASGIFIQSCDRHCRIYDNYFEQVEGVPCTGFIKLSESGMPAIFGSNTPSSAFSIFCLDNRIDGQQEATSFVYWLKAADQVNYIRSSGYTAISSTPGLVIENDFLPIRKSNAFHPFTYYRFEGEEFGKWATYNNYKAFSDGNSLCVDARSLPSIVSDRLNDNDAVVHLGYDAEAIVMFTTNTVLNIVIFGAVDGLQNIYLKNGNNYNVMFQAKTDSGSGDTLSMGYLSGGGGPLTPYVLTDQYEEFSFTCPGNTSTAEVGFYFSRSTFNGNIKIKNVSFSKI